MKIGFYQFVINPEFPVYRMMGGEKHMAVYDDLHCRILVIDDGKKPLYHVSVDTVEIFRWYYERIKDVIEKHIGKEIILITCATHDHFCPGLTNDENYQEFLLKLIEENLDNIEMKEYQKVEYSFTSEFFDKTGTSRISIQPSKHIYAQTLCFYGDGKRIGTILIYNSHATTMRMKTGNFTSEYPGYAINRLKYLHPGEFFTFMLGPAGDISSRFTRKSQEYTEIYRLGELLVQEYEKELSMEPVQHEIKELKYEEYDLPMQYELPDLSKYIVPENMSQRERETIEFAKKKDKFTQEQLDAQPKTTKMSHLILSPEFSLILEPFEMFSSYYDYINMDTCALITIANGFGHYIPSIDEKYLSFESVGDIVSRETKENICTLFRKWSNQL